MGTRISLGKEFFTIRYEDGLSTVYRGQPKKGNKPITFFNQYYEAVLWAEKILKEEFETQFKKKSWFKKG